MPQQKYVVKVKTIHGRIENIEVRADSVPEAMTRAAREDFVRNALAAWQGTVR